MKDACVRVDLPCVNRYSLTVDAARSNRTTQHITHLSSLSTYYKEYTVDSGYVIMKQHRAITYMHCVLNELVF